MQDAECNYDIQNKELLAIIQALKELKWYTRRSPTPMPVLTDHKSLVTFMITKDLSERQVRCQSFLSPYNFKIDFRRGEEREEPDARTRRLDDQQITGDNRLTRNVEIFLANEEYWDIQEGEGRKIEEIELA